MSMSISTYNYLLRPELVSVESGFTRRLASRYSYCPAEADEQLKTITIKNVSGGSLHIGSLVLGNVEDIEVATSLISIGATSYATTKVFSSATTTNYRNIFDRHRSSGHLKNVPIILDENKTLILPNNGQIIVTFVNPVRCGWIWLGGLSTLRRGISLPTKAELKNDTKYIELENGDKLIHTSLFKKSITCEFSNMDETDRSFMQNHLHNGEMYYVNGFNPFNTPLANYLDQSFSTTYEHDITRWKSFSGLMRQMSPLNINFSRETLYSTSVQFSEII